MTSPLVDHVVRALEATERGSTKLPASVFGIPGMSGRKTRIFYNNVCALPGARYLEIGTFKGSSLVAALYGNAGAKATVIDNWSEYGGPRDEFRNNVQTFIPEADLQMIDGDCFSVAKSVRGPFNIYMYDGWHSYEAQRDGVLDFWEHLDDEFVLLVDDWNVDAVRRGTHDALRQKGAEILFSKEIIYTENDAHTPYHIAEAEFWNGIGIFVVRKPV